MTKSTYILGISESHTSSAALLKDGEIVAAASEERFTRKKLQAGIPKNAIKYCLDFAKIDEEDLNCVAIADITPPIFSTQKTKIQNPKTLSAFKNLTFDIEQSLEQHLPKTRDLFYNIYKNLAKLKTNSKFKFRLKNLQKALSLKEEKFTFVPHHTCHAYSALFASPFPTDSQPTLIATADGVGDFESATLSKFHNFKFQKLVSVNSQQSLGFFYLHITQLLGMKPIEDEYKVMGLAGYVDKKKSQDVYQILTPYFKLEKSKNRWAIAVNEFHLWRKLPTLLKYKRFDTIAAAAQQILEEILTDWIENALRNYKIENIACGGGVFANIKVNQKIAQIKSLKKAFFMPSPTDETNAIGAAYWCHFTKTGHIPKSLDNLYLGPSFSQEQIQSALKLLTKNPNVHIKREKDINGIVANLLAKGEVVARFAGRMEFGARALGARSILAHPGKLELVSFLNLAIKNRDFWMPFAPTILRERTEDYLKVHKADSPFMNVAYNTTPKGQVDLTAAIHPHDKTTRPQILDLHINPSYYDLVKKFERLTGIGAVLNTSFNLHGEPIVCTPQDAIRTFLDSGLKYLQIETYLLIKNA